MAIQFPNFLGQGEKPADYSGISNLLTNALQGYRISQEPAAMGRKAESEQLANALQQMALKNQPEKMSLENQLLKARIDQARRLTQKNMTPQEHLEQKLALEQRKSNIKEAKDIKQTSKDLISALRDVQGIENLYEDKDEAVTGFFPGLANKLNMSSSSKLGQFNERATRLQASLARMISQRGGAVAAQIAAQGKPSGWKSKEYNLGITSSMKENIKKEFDNLNKEYKEITGKELPYELDDIVHDQVKKVAEQHNRSNKVVHMKAPNGKDVWIPEDRVEDALKQGAKRV